MGARRWRTSRMPHPRLRPRVATPGCPSREPRTPPRPPSGRSVSPNPRDRPRAATQHVPSGHERAWRTPQGPAEAGPIGPGVVPIVGRPHASALVVPADPCRVGERRPDIDALSAGDQIGEQGSELPSDIRAIAAKHVSTWKPLLGVNGPSLDDGRRSERPRARIPAIGQKPLHVHTRSGTACFVGPYLDDDPAPVVQTKSGHLRHLR